MSWKLHSLINKGYSLVEKGNYQEAVHAFFKAVELNADNNELHAYLGEAYYLNKEYDKAASAFKRREQLLLEADPLTPYIEGYRGCIALQQNDHQQAQKLLEKAIAKNVKDPEIYYRLGLLYKLQGKSSQARTTLKQVDKLDPTFTYKKIQELIKDISTAAENNSEKK